MGDSSMRNNATHQNEYFLSVSKDQNEMNIICRRHSLMVSMAEVLGSNPGKGAND